MTDDFHLAQVNIARSRAPLDDPVMTGFMTQLEAVNQLADKSPGFVWRLQTDAGDATAIQVFEDPLLIINLSVWQDIESLRRYVYSGAHLGLLKNKKQWFEKLDTAFLALWWIPAGDLPSPASARDRLDRIKRDGPGPDAFNFAQAYTPDGSVFGRTGP